MYVSHITYLVWRKNRKLNEAIPLIIQKSIESIKPKIKENRKLLRSFVQKRLTEFSLKVSKQFFYFIISFINLSLKCFNRKQVLAIFSLKEIN